jgi:prepilin-type N-terminal cleavage/methylation domain-containing protein
MEISEREKQSSIAQNGYTLIEILVALTIIGLLFGFGYASFRDFSRRQAVKDAAKIIQGDLRLAQENAISGLKPEGVGGCGTSNTLNSYGFRIVSASEYIIEANCGVTPAPFIKDVNLPTGITIQTPLPSVLEFKVLGQGTNVGSTNWTLTLIQSGTTNTTTVTVTAGGEIR